MQRQRIGTVAAVLLAVTMGVASARAAQPSDFDPTPHPGATRTELRALAESRAHLADAYTLPPAQLAKAERKARLHTMTHFGGEIWSVLALLLLLQTGAVAAMERRAVSFSRRIWFQGLLFTALLLLSIALLDLPVDVIRQHVARVYGLSVQGWGSWAWDHAKSLLLEIAVGWPLAVGTLLLLRRRGRRWWLPWWAVSVPCVLLVVFLVPIVIEPMFDHFDPLATANPALTAQLQRVVDKGGMGITPERMFLMRASDKVTGMNAYVTGFGASKRVVVWDTTVAKARPDEILFIFGHEMGHYVLGHIARGIALTVAGMFVGLWLCARLLSWAMARFGARWRLAGDRQWGALAVLLLLSGLLGLVSEPIAATISRMQEHDADVFGQEVVHGIVADPQTTGREAFQRLGETSLTEPDPSPWLELWSFDHPSLTRRAAFAAAYDPWAEQAEPRFFAKEPPPVRRSGVRE